MVSVQEKSRGIKYDKVKIDRETEIQTPQQTLQTLQLLNWKAPGAYQTATIPQCRQLRRRLRIVAEGEEVPCPMVDFDHYNFPSFITSALRRHGITTPTAVQAQMLPALLAGRDAIGVASTGSGKTLVFVLPLVLLCHEFESKLPLRRGEGPFAVVISPSRELALQSAETIRDFSDPRNPCKVKALIGGVSLHDQVKPVWALFVYVRVRLIPSSWLIGFCLQLTALAAGVHAVVGTPGRVADLMERRGLRLNQCMFVCLDEADRLLDLGFEKEVRQRGEVFYPS